MEQPYSITDALPVIVAAVVIGLLLGMAITYGVSKCLEQPKVKHITKGSYISQGVVNIETKVVSS